MLRHVLRKLHQGILFDRRLSLPFSLEFKKNLNSTKKNSEKNKKYIMQ